MWQGHVVSLFISPEKGAPMLDKQQVRAIAGAGLEGDRYAKELGTIKKSIRHVTLIETEALDALFRDYQIELSPGQTRRNILVSGVPLNHLVNQFFSISGVQLKGVELCEPCGYLEGLTLPGVKLALTHRGGLRAEIITSGLIEVGAPIRPADSA